MSQATSTSTGQRYGVARICRAWDVARSTVYHRRRRQGLPPHPGSPAPRRGPKPKYSDAELAARIRHLVAEVEGRWGIRGEGYRKVWARLRFAGVRVCRHRVLRVMRAHGLLAPMRVGRRRGPRVHDGTIVTARPDVMWGADATTVFTRLEGVAWAFVAVDHCASECVGIHAAKEGTRFEALEPIHQGVRESFGALGEGAATGLRVRHDHGSQYMSDVFQRELKFVGIESSPSFVGSPQGNGVAERFIRTLKEQLLWVRTFDTVEGLREALLEFKRCYNEQWILGCHGYKTPAQVRRAMRQRRLDGAPSAAA